MALPTDNSSGTSPRTSRLNRIAQAKLTPGVAALFFVALALMCMAAAGIGYVAQQMRHAQVHRTPG